MRLTVIPKWYRRPKLDGWYLFRFSYSNEQEVVRVVQCRNLGKDTDSFDLGFSIEHEAMGCIHRNKDQKEFWFAYIDLNHVEHYTPKPKSSNSDSEATEAVDQATTGGIQNPEGRAGGGE